MKILLNSQDKEIETSKLMCYSNSLSQFIEYNFENRIQNRYQIDFPNLKASCVFCLCLLPDNSIFCCGSAYWDAMSDFLFIIDENYNIKILPSQDIYTQCSATYYNNYIYFCGDGFIERFDLTKWKWKKLFSLTNSSYSSTCISFNGMILISSHQDNNIFVLDLLTLSISSFKLEIEANSTKVLFTWENSAFLIDISGKLIKSDNGNPFSWDLIGMISPLNYIVYGYKVLYQDSIYFYGHPFIIKFDLKEKKFEKISLNN